MVVVEEESTVESFLCLFGGCARMNGGSKEDDDVAQGEATKIR